MTTTNDKRSGGVLTHFARWLFSWRGARALLITIAWLLTLVALVYGIENWRGNRQWKAVSQDLERRGEELNLSRLLSSNNAPDQAFGASPLVTEALSKNKAKGNRFSWAQDVLPSQRGKGTERRRTDLNAWAQAFKATEAGPSRVDLQRNPAGTDDPQARANAARVVLQALSQVEPGTKDIPDLLNRSRPRSSGHQGVNPYEAPPYFALIRSTCQRIELEACAHLASGDSEAGLQSIFAGLDLADAVRKEPYFIAQLVRVAGMQLLIQPIWEGLADHRWNQEQLDRLNSRLGKINVLSDLDLAIDSERAVGLLTIDIVRDHGDVAMLEVSESSRAGWSRRTLVQAFPDGWFAMEKANFCRNLDAIVGGFDFTNRTVSPKVLSEARDQLNRKLTPAQALRTHQVASRLLLPALASACGRFALAQAHLDMCRIAAAVEKYRLNKNAYPESLSQLDSVELLPRELFPGHPAYRYQLQDKGYLLYSIGWDLDDDLGQHAGRNTNKEGDWPWGHITR